MTYLSLEDEGRFSTQKSKQVDDDVGRLASLEDAVTLY